MAKKAAKKATKKKATKKKAGKKKTTRKKAAKKKAGKRKSYSAKKKQLLLAKYLQLKAGGETAQKAAKKVGVPYITLRSWEKKAGKGGAGKLAKKKATRKAGRPRKVAKGKAGRPKASAGRGHMVLVTPDGNRIEGISTNDLIRVLKALK